MRARSILLFPPFRLDPDNEQLWQDDRLRPLRPKTFAVLRYLAERAGVLVTKEELLHAIWPGAHGAEGLPKKSVYELRKVLGDEAETPRFIETVPRRGWRFVAPVGPSHAPRRGGLAPHPAPTLVGREAELAQLHGGLERALEGGRHVVFVTGEPGIGKTAVVQAFWTGLAGERGLCLARGQCVEHHGVGEAYLPVLEALGRLCRQPGGERVLGVLRQHAPSWLLQMPSLIDDAELETLRRKVLGALHDRMLREMAEALEALSAEHPLVLWLEDLQWSDYSTLDLIRYLAQRHGPARLLLIGTCRLAEVIAGGHPLRAVKQELQGHGQCVELSLRGLTAAEVAQYLILRFGSAAQAAPQHRELARLIHQNTDGNPLFMVNMVDYLAARGAIGEVAGHWQVRVPLEKVAADVPDSLRQLIERQLDRLSPEEQRVLEVASVAGLEFSVIAVAAGLVEPRDRAEEWCEALARRGRFLAGRGAEPLRDGTAAGRYGFRHALYQKVLYDRLGAARRLQLHRRIGEGLEAAHGEQAGAIAAELAMHFEQGRAPGRAVQYLAQAAQNAVQRSANREAIDLLRRGLDLVRALPDPGQRAEQELALQVALAVPLMMTRGYTAPEVKAAYERARELCRQIGDTPHIFPVVVGLSRFYYGRSSIERKQSSAAELLRLARRERDPSLLLVAHMMQSGNLFFQGEFARAQTHAEEGLALYDPSVHRTLAFLYGDDPQILCHCWAALALWYRGYPDQALARVHLALRTAQDLGYPFGLVFARFWTAFLHQARGEPAGVEEHSEALIMLAESQGIPQFAAMGTILRGWVVTQLGRQAEGVDQIRQGIARLRAVGQELGRPYFSALLAEAYRQCGRPEEGLSVVNEALAVTQTTGECMHQAELYRLRGELLCRAGRGAPDGHRKSAPDAGATGSAEAEACVRTALEVAGRQGAKSLELRATVSLSRLWQRQGDAEKARRMLAQAHRWFAEGHDTQDLREAKALLAELEQTPAARGRRSVGVPVPGARRPHRGTTWSRA
jgi:DNA-binding winged helix-turn-helix (wHTH) protein/predicted ATPase/type II secretory pathway predicted ATPase ExeA